MGSPTTTIGSSTACQRGEGVGLAPGRFRPVGPATAGVDVHSDQIHGIRLAAAAQMLAAAHTAVADPGSVAGLRQLSGAENLF